MVAERASHRCEYCQVPRKLIVILEVDHIIPTARGGQATAENLCLCCRHCNGRKNVFTKGIDPDADTVVNLFNPRTQTWAEHFAWSPDGLTILGLSPTGRATVEKLKMNTPIVVEARRFWVALGLHPPSD
jgi:hypothetical protein